MSAEYQPLLKPVKKGYPHKSNLAPFVANVQPYLIKTMERFAQVLFNVGARQQWTPGLKGKTGGVQMDYL